MLSKNLGGKQKKEAAPFIMRAINALIGTPLFDNLLKIGLTIPCRNIDQSTR
jgi:hypothetical protein